MQRITSPENDIFTFAYCGSRQFFENTQLAHLAKLAESEKWTSASSDRKNDILYYYIVKTFEIVHKEGLISYSEDHQLALFNTGLMTPNGAVVNEKNSVANVFQKNGLPSIFL